MIQNPRDMAQDFYSSTFIPVSAYSCEGELLYQGGDPYRRGGREIFEKLLATMSRSSLDSYDSLTLSSEDSYSYTASSINPQRPKDGFVVIGPYRAEDIGRLCRPEFCKFNSLLFTGFSGGSQCALKDCKGCYSLKVRRALDFIDTHYRNPITLDEVASRLELNKCYFCTLFKQETGRTFTAHLNHVRIEKSKRYLLQGNRSILDVALSVGYTSQNYYTITFKKLTKMTPMEFRRFS